MVRKGVKWKMEGISGSLRVDVDELLEFIMFSYNYICVYVVF